MSTHKDSSNEHAKEPVNGPANHAATGSPDGADRLRSERHLSDADVAALIYGSELDRPISSTAQSAVVEVTHEPARTHVDSCDVCRRRVAKARAEDNASALLLSVLDAPAPTLDAASVLARARESGRSNHSRGEHTFPARSLPTPAFVPAFVPARRSRQYRYAMAASFLFAAIGVTALAFPGSPLRGLWEDVGQKSGAATVRGVQDVTRADASSAVSTSSIAMAPAPNLTIDFHGTNARLPRLTVRYCDTTFATLRVLRSGGSPSAASDASSNTSPVRAAAHPERFSVSADRIIVMQDSSTAAGNAIYQLMVPNSTRSLSVTARGKVANVRRLPSDERHNTDRCDLPITITWTP